MGNALYMELSKNFWDHLAAFNGDFVLAGVTTHNDGNVFFHRLIEYGKAKVKKNDWLSYICSVKEK